MSGAISRTVSFGQPLGVAPRGALAASVPAMFPNKNPNETLDYAGDFSFEMQGGADSAINVGLVTVNPVVPGGPVISNISPVGMVVNFRVGSGVPGMTFVICVSAVLPSGRVLVGYASLYINPAPQPSAAPGTAGAAQVLTTDGGAGLTTDGGNPLTTT